jgi:hypothetical protein
MTILDTAKEVIYGDREKTYGDPGRNLRVVGNFWQTFLRAKYSVDIELTTEDVCHMMSLLKIARLTNTPGHTDSLVDLCGYTALVERVNVHLNQKAGNSSQAARP